MQYQKTEKDYFIRLMMGENLVEKLTTFCVEKGINTGVLQGIGTASQVEIGAYNLKEKAYHWKVFNKNLEIVSLTGNVSLVDDKPFLHMHTVLSDENYACFGGHLKEAIVGPTCEIFLTNLETAISREYDESTGLKLLACVSSKNQV
ncbi:MAG: PPC domain-containing DNA-binding protein [Patescibacteria group bacterium]